MSVSVGNLCAITVTVLGERAPSHHRVRSAQEITELQMLSSREDCDAENSAKVLKERGHAHEIKRSSQRISSKLSE